MRVPRSALALLAVALAACGFDPHPKDGQLPCDKGCPSGYVCTANRCWQNASIDAGNGGATGAVDAAGGAGAVADASISGTGGAASTDAAVEGTGGAASTGGIAATGGATGSGGIAGTGGLSGGVSGKGGSTAGGGATGSGGAAGTGGMLATGGATGAGGTVVPRLAIFAGVPSGVGIADGTGSAARFCAPRGMAVDEAGTIFVADYGNEVIRKVTASGVVTTFAGMPGSSGSADGTLAAARFNGPFGVAMDGAGNLFVAEWWNDTIRKITTSGVVTTFAGTAGSVGNADGVGTAARFSAPHGVAVDASGNVFVADTGNNTIRKITPAGVVTTLAGSAGSSGSADGTGAAARFGGPFAVAVDGAGNVFVADTDNNTIRKITAAGVVTTLAGSAGTSGSADGTGTAARFDGPWGVALDVAGNVFVADAGNNTIRKITPAGVVTTPAGSATANPDSVDGTGAGARFSGLSGVAVDRTGAIFVADGDTIRKITPDGVVSTLAGWADSSGSADGTAAAARFDGVEDVAADGEGNIFVADGATIRKITPLGVVTTFAGKAGTFGGDDGIGAAASFLLPHGLAVDGIGNLFVADYALGTIRKITPLGVVTTLAGSAGAGSGSADGTGVAARFDRPSGVAVTKAGDLYVADYGNATIRKITPSGVVTTFAGSAGSGGSVDGTGANARFSSPSGVAVDEAGNAFVADWNHTIRKITPAGVVTTFAGSAGSPGSADGAGAIARFSYPSGIAVDGSGNVYVADSDNNAIRKITPAGVVSTVVGVAASASAGNLPGPLPGSLLLPRGVAIDRSRGRLYIALPSAVMVADGVL